MRRNPPVLKTKKMPAYKARLKTYTKKVKIEYEASFLQSILDVLETENITEKSKLHDIKKLIYNRVKKLQDPMKHVVEFKEKNLSKMTTYEGKFFDILVSLGIEFIPQKPLRIKGRNYIIDFYVPSQKLIIEIDGGYHYTEEQSAKDTQRDEACSKEGYKVLRIDNEEIEDLDIDNLKIWLGILK